MNRNLNRRIHPIAEADGLSPKKPRKPFNPLAMIENYSISQNKAGSLLVTLVLGMSIGDLQPKVTRDERFVRVDCVLHRTYDLTFEGDPNGYRVITMERDADKVIAETKKWIEDNKEILDITKKMYYDYH